MSKINNNKISNKDNSNTPIISALQIDKLSPIIDMPDDKLCNVTYSSIISWLETNEPNVVKVKPNGKYHLAVKIHYPDEDGVIHQKSHSIRLEINHSKAAKRQIRLEYNPRDMNKAGEEYLDMMFQGIIGLTFYELLFHARFTRVDFCRDIMNSDIEDYLFQSKHSKYSQCFFGGDGKLQALNFGKSENNQILVYDKAKELYGSKTELKQIRIEARCRINLTIAGLKSFKNPLRNVQIYSVACKEYPFGFAHWVAFQDSCRVRGVGNAIKKQPPEHRYKLKQVLSTKPVTWWKIENKDWEFYLLSALKNARLDNIPSSAPPLSYSFHIGQAA